MLLAALQIHGCEEPFTVRHAEECYYYEPMSMTFTDARTSCQLHGGDLARINGLETSSDALDSFTTTLGAG